MKPSMREAVAEAITKFFLVLFGLLGLYIAFLWHDALYPGGDIFKRAVVIVVAYLGFVALHRAQHLRDDDGEPGRANL